MWVMALTKTAGGSDDQNEWEIRTFTEKPDLMPGEVFREGAEKWKIVDLFQGNA